MKKIIFAVLISVSIIYSQVDISGGMGINFVSSPSLKDYINGNYNQGGEKLNAFSSSVEFFGEITYSLNSNFELGVDYGLSIFSYNSSSGNGGIYDLNYTMQKPTLVAYYVIPGEGYKFKFGGGAGIRMIDLDEKIIVEQNYSSTGYGFLARAEGHTKLGGDVYAYVGTDLRYDMPGKPENDNGKLAENSSYDVDLNTFSWGIKLGVSLFL
ncbi:MAG: hypothetical protein K8F36_14880 [Melioribacteraceae bacterium]|nr:hypothetical protein [Melioribacteraceae bacterium]